MGMGSADRSRKRIQLWKKALIHFALCFVMGFFIGFAPASTASIFSASSLDTAADAGHLVSSFRPPNADNVLNMQAFEHSDESGVLNRSLMDDLPLPTPSPATPTTGSDFQTEGGRDFAEEEDADAASTTSPAGKLLIVITTTRSNDRFQGPFLRRLAHTLRLVPPPLLWLVVQAHAEVPATAEMLRSTGIMYRHLAFKENITDAVAEANHQRNVALSHIEYHRLSGIVHFAGVSNFYDLRFFDEIRQIEVFGAWPVAMVSTNRKRVVVDGPICQSSKIVGWFLGDLGNDTTSARNLMTNAGMNMKPSKINISGFAFNSSILWDPERWGRPTSLPDTSQDSIKFVQDVVLEDETKLKGIPADCSRIMLWHLYIPRVIPLPFHQSQDQDQHQR